MNTTKRTTAKVLLAGVAANSDRAYLPKSFGAAPWPSPGTNSTAH
jgi:hypothetical protein